MLPAKNKPPICFFPPKIEFEKSGPNSKKIEIFQNLLSAFYTIFGTLENLNFWREKAYRGFIFGGKHQRFFEVSLGRN